MLINSDVRSEIEKLRWTSTRRGLIAIAALASMSPFPSPFALEQADKNPVFVVTSIRLSKNKKGRKSGDKDKHEGNKDDTHDFENRLLPSDGLTESLANSGARTSGASFVSLG